VRIVLTLALAACQDPEPVVVEGVVWSAQGPTAPPLPDASVTFVDETGVVLDAVEAGSDGVFRARVPAGLEVFAEIRAEGYATTTFPGVTGLEPTFTVEDHALYGVTVEARDAFVAQYEGCPGAADGGPIVMGEIRLYGLVDDLGVSPIVTTGVAGVGQVGGCYLDADGLRYEPKAAETGSSGVFAVFGAEPGVGVLDVAYQPFTDVWSVEDYRLWLPDEDGVVSPWYPAWVELVF
jgi:hypothetical protein